MRARLLLALIPCGAALAGGPSALAQAAAPRPPTTVSPVTIAPKAEAPRLVSSFPAPGQALPPGVMVVTLRFDQPMAQGFDIGPAVGHAAPRCLKRPRLLNDTQTFVLLCTTAPGKSYGLAINGAPDKEGFASRLDKRAQPATLDFTTTSSADGPHDLAAAMKVAGLGELDAPIQDTPSLPPETTNP